MTAAPTTIHQRERGTLKTTLPSKPIAPLFLVCLVSAILSTLLFLYSFSSSDDDAGATLWPVFGVSSLGSVTALVGIVFGDSLMHSFVFGVAVSSCTIILMAICVVGNKKITVTNCRPIFFRDNRVRLKGLVVSNNLWP